MASLKLQQLHRQGGWVWDFGYTGSCPWSSAQMGGGGVTYDPDIPRLKHFVKKAIPKINHCFLLWQPFSFTVLRVSMLCSLFVTTCKEKVCGCNNVLFDLLKKKYHPKFEGFSLRNYMPINMLKKLDVCYI